MASECKLNSCGAFQEVLVGGKNIGEIPFAVYLLPET
jgi:hypothetical protein